MRKFHPAAETTTQASVESESSCETSCNSKEDKSNEWDRDPEIELDFALSSDSDDEECEKAVEATDDSLTIGRIERKRTTPDPVRAPMKKKVKSGPSTPVDDGDKKGQSGCELVKDSENKVDKGVQCSTLRCEHCKIDFEDEDDILFAIHRGWHNLSEPFQCNLCGDKCGKDRLSIATLEDIIASNFMVEHVMKRDRNQTLQ